MHLFEALANVNKLVLRKVQLIFRDILAIVKSGCQSCVNSSEYAQNCYDIWIEYLYLSQLVNPANVRRNNQRREVQIC